jgi:hypothetical protein
MSLIGCDGKPRPNPGSQEALALGCTCPVSDNHCGAGAYGGPVTNDDGTVTTPFWITDDCPLHGPISGTQGG